MTRLLIGFTIKNQVDDSTIYKNVENMRSEVRRYRNVAEHIKYIINAALLLKSQKSFSWPKMKFNEKKMYTKVK